MIDTLTFLPHVNDLETVLESSSDIREIVMKSLEIVSIFTYEQEFSTFFASERANLFLKVIIPYLKIT